MSTVETKARRGLPYIWPTWICGLVAGEKHCQFAAWYKAHYSQYEKREDPDGDAMTDHRAKHASMVNLQADYLRRHGYAVQVEGENKFTFKGKAAVVGGCADIIATSGGKVVVDDCKTGKERDGDFYQLVLYLMLYPRIFRDLFGGREAHGRLIYTGRVREVNPNNVAKGEPLVVAQIQRTAAAIAPPTTPSVGECRYCNIASCADRKESAAEVTDEGLF